MLDHVGDEAIPLLCAGHPVNLIDVLWTRHVDAASIERVAAVDGLAVGFTSCDRVVER